jgi:hypothetical protein
MGGVLLTPLWGMLIARHGFPTAAVAVSALMLACVVPAALLALPGRITAAAAPSGRQALGELDAPSRARYHQLATAMAVSLVAQVGLTAHLIRLLQPRWGWDGASGAMALATACAVLGRSVAVAAIQRGFARRRVAQVSYIVQTAGCLATAAFIDWGWAALAGVLLFGAGIGNATSLPPLIAQLEFTDVQLAHVVSRMVALSQGLYAFAPALFGWVLTHGTWSFFLLAAACMLCAAALVGRQAT